MDKLEFTKEQNYLNETIELLNEKIFEGEELSNTFSLKLQEGNQEYLSGMREMNLNNMNDDTMLELSFKQNNLSYLKEAVENAIKENKTYSSMLKNPYFAKISIIPSDSKILESYYIGIHSLIKDNNYKIIDWRSPISEIFYNYEIGKAYIKTNADKFECELTNKRQFKIVNGNLEYYFDTNLTINDEILKDALGQSKSGGLKSIIQTIQKEQNAIIRKDEYKTLLVNGVAGSGKTAIALHRVAYLLYKLKGKLTSNEVLLLSPNEAFSDYISTVLPELSEDDILKFQLDSVVKKHLSKKLLLEKRYEQIERLILKQNYIDEYKYKFSYGFYSNLLKFCNELKNTFVAKDIVINDTEIGYNNINNMFYDKYSHLDIFTRICYITDKIVSDNFYFIKNKLRIKMLKQQVFASLYDMFKEKNVYKLYSKFLESLNLKFTLLNNKVKNEDAYALFVIRSTLFGYPNYSHIKHLVIDEVQDYSCVQLYIISRLFNCPKTILGDVHQSIISDVVSDNFNNVEKIFNEELSYIELKTSYRPTKQIADLYNHINKTNSKDVVLRNGEQPDFILFNDNKVMQLKEQISLIKKSYKSVAIITKTNKQARELYNQLNDSEIQLISNSYDLIRKDVIIISSFNSKGMEFDCVVCYDVSDSVFKSDYDNKLLFIMISRALHKVVLMYDKLPKILLDYDKM